MLTIFAENEHLFTLYVREFKLPKHLFSKIIEIEPLDERDWRLFSKGTEISHLRRDIFQRFIIHLIL